MRFFIAMVSHETNTFSPLPTGRRQFEARDLRVGAFDPPHSGAAMVFDHEIVRELRTHALAVLRIERVEDLAEGRRHGSARIVRAPARPGLAQRRASLAGLEEDERGAEAGLVHLVQRQELDLEAAALRGDQGQVADLVGVCVKQRGCQTDSLGGVVSLDAVFDADFHRLTPYQVE